MSFSKKCAVYILLGQSQAVGHGIPMDEKDKIKIPLKNVYGLHRKTNQSYEIDNLTWSNYMSNGMNLGETQDDTYSLANCLAALWQSKVDAGVDLPDLYIVHIAIGAQGVTESYMWNPKKEKILVPGKLWTANISLYSFTKHILSLLKKSFDTMGKEYDVIGLHWRGGEEDIRLPVDHLKGLLKDTYTELFNGFLEALGSSCPITISRIIECGGFSSQDPTGEYSKSLNYINTVFNELEKENKNISSFDLRQAPHYDEHVKGCGICITEDCVHYNRQTNQWNAKKILDDYLSL